MTITNSFEKLDEIRDKLSQISVDKNGKYLIKEYLKKIRFDFVLNSLIVSGFEIDEASALLFIETGQLSNRYSLNEYLMLKNYYKATEYIFDKSLENIELSSDLLRELHSFLTRGLSEIKIENKSHLIEIIPGDFVNEGAESNLIELIEQYNVNKDSVNQIEQLITFYVKLLLINPFSYGTTIIAFLLFNIFLLKNGFIPIIISKENIDTYNDCLMRAKSGTYAYIKDFFISVIEENVDKCISAITKREVNNRNELKKRIDEFYKNIKPNEQLYTVNQITNEIKNIDVSDNIRSIYSLIKDLCFDLFKNKNENDLEWEIKAPVRIDNFPIANSAIIVEYFGSQKINILNTLVGPTYLDYISEGSGIYIKILPKKRYIPKSSIAFCVLASYRSLFIVGSTSVAHIESGEERLVPNEKSKVFHIEGPIEFNKWQIEKIEEFLAKCIDNYLYLIEKEVEERKSSFSFSFN